MEKEQAQTTVAEEVVTTPAAEDGANAGTVEEKKGAEEVAQNDSVNGAAFSESASDGDDKGSREHDGKKKEMQTKEQNAENARRRREAQKQKEIREMRDKTIISTLRGKNPYTNEEMKDSLDVEEYLAMREIEENGGDPVEDYNRVRKQKARDDAKQQEETSKQEEWFQKDREDFCSAHPDVDLDELIANEDFRDYADGKVGKRTMTDIYAGYMKREARMRERAEELAAQMIANQKATPGALGTTQEVASDYFTPDQVRKMSEAEVSKNYEKIMESMKKWH